MSYLSKHKPDSGWRRMLSENPPTLQFWYRESPKDMVADGFVTLTPGVVTFSDPPRFFSNMVNLRLDPAGRLLYFQAIPPERQEHAEEKPTDWQPLFAAAGLNAETLKPATAQWNVLSASDSDQRAAWGDFSVR